ncbi:MAG TPA: AI-2E family transporter [Thermoanaerobaculia bacterium]
MSDVAVQARSERREWRVTGIIFFGLLALLLLYAAFIILRPFIAAILLGAILVTLTYRVYERLRDRWKGRAALAAVVMLVAVTLLIVLPFTIIGILLVEQANTVFQKLQSVDAQQMLHRLDITSRLRWIQHYVPTFDPATLSPERLLLPAVKLIPAWVASHGAAVVGGVAGLALDFALVLLSAYFFYIEGETILQELFVLSPLPPRHDREIASQFKEVIDATFLGQISSTLAQGVATGIGLAIVGVPGALFWGAVVAIFGLLPMVGAAIVWVPAAIYLYIGASMGERGYWQPIFLTLWGLLVVQLIDHIVRPWVMRGKSQLPAIPLLFAVLGGLHAFGFVGLVIGPLVFSLLMTIVGIYKRSFQIQGSDSAVA